MAELIEGVDYHLFYLDFVNRANPALAVLNDDGTADVYLNTLYDEERLREELEHELRHLRDQHFHVSISVERAERQADGEPVDLIGAAKERGRILRFQSEAAFANYIKTLAAQRGVDLARCGVEVVPVQGEAPKKRQGRSHGVKQGN